MQRKKFRCESCDAHGTIVHDLDLEYYRIEVCPFCGADIGDNSEYDDDE